MKKVGAVVLCLLMLAPTAAWSASKYLTVKSNAVNFREKPSSKAKVLFSLDKYYPLLVIGSKGGWYKVKDFEGDRGWMHQSVLTSKFRGVVIKVAKANLRLKPTTKSKIAFTAARGAAFRYLKKQGDWLLVQHADGDKAWVHHNLVWGR